LRFFFIAEQISVNYVYSQAITFGFQVIATSIHVAIGDWRRHRNPLGAQQRQLAAATFTGRNPRRSVTWHPDSRFHLIFIYLPKVFLVFSASRAAGIPFAAPLVLCYARPMRLIMPGRRI